MDLLVFLCSFSFGEYDCLGGVSVGGFLVGLCCCFCLGFLGLL